MSEYLSCGGVSTAGRSASRTRPEHDGNERRKISLSFESAMNHRITMSIRPENRWLYPIDWRQVSDTIRFGRDRALRTVRAAASPLRRASRRRPLVGRRNGMLALRARSTDRGARPVRVGWRPHDLCRPGLCASRSRSWAQHAGQPRRLLPALPHAPRCGRASMAALVEQVPSMRAARPLRRPALDARAPHAWAYIGARVGDFGVATSNPSGQEERSKRTCERPVDSAPACFARGAPHAPLLPFFRDPTNCPAARGPTESVVADSTALAFECPTIG